MQFMLLIYGEEGALERLNPDEMAQEIGAYMAYKQELEKAGALVAGGRLQPVAAAKTVSIENGKQRVLDGPFAETKETLAGYHLVQCETLEEAVAWAARAPGARRGRIEVRPLVTR
jgi:hypothetical protein